jgi:Prokaryotic E2 family A/ThiF family/Prokaryotic homologs of the JAB domain
MTRQCDQQSLHPQQSIRFYQLQRHMAKLYLEQLPRLPAALLSQPIQEALLELQKAYPNQQISAHGQEDAKFAFVFLKVDVSLPSRGAVDDLDIRSLEPVFLAIDRRLYPFKAPFAYSNRPDFPKGKLPHINPGLDDLPANFCLHRGNLDEWFAEHTIVDLVERIKGWLRDAAAGLLVRSNDGFEPLRLDGLKGIFQYDPTPLRRHILSHWETGGGSSFCWLGFEIPNNTEINPFESGENCQLNLIAIHGDSIPEDFLKVAECFKDLHLKSSLVSRWSIGVLVWAESGRVYPEYFTELPNSFSDFELWVDGLGVPANKAVAAYRSDANQLYDALPIIVALRRPQVLLGSNSDIELLNFILDLRVHPLANSSSVTVFGHRTPLTPQRAREISSITTEPQWGRTALFGCGALGSKIALHFARSGQTKLDLIDPDGLTTHNLVRNGLLANRLGQNKAYALKQEINAIFQNDPSLDIAVFKSSLEEFLIGENKERLLNCSWIFDATASRTALEALCCADLLARPDCFRCEIADGGGIGLVTIEGPGRNPRLDDIQAQLFDLSLDDPSLSRWLQEARNEREGRVGSHMEQIVLGLGCRTETLKLSDDIISFHASTFAMEFRQLNEQGLDRQTGGLRIVKLNVPEMPSTAIEKFEILPVKVVPNANQKGTGWEMRLKHGLAEQMQTELDRNRPKETGGLLIGMINFKRKIVYVTRLLEAPKDSVGSGQCFVRGIMDLPEDIDAITEASGGLLGYVGEWHTHPNGSRKLSIRDKQAITQLRQQLEPSGLVTLVILVTDEGLTPFIYPPDQP